MTQEQLEAVLKAVYTFGSDSDGIKQDGTKMTPEEKTEDEDKRYAADLAFSVHQLRNYSREQLFNLWRMARPVSESLPKSLNFLQGAAEDLPQAR
jgi:hypothetical protein